MKLAVTDEYKLEIEAVDIPIKRKEIQWKYWDKADWFNNKSWHRMKAIAEGISQDKLFKITKAVMTVVIYNWEITPYNRRRPSDTRKSSIFHQ